MNNNRRGFLKQILLAGTAFTILPAATTYQRLWVAKRPEPVLYFVEHPEYQVAGYVIPAHNSLWSPDFVYKMDRYVKILGGYGGILESAISRGGKVTALYNYSA